MSLEDFANPRFLRDRIFNLDQRVTLREEHDQQQDARLERHEELLSILTTIVRGNAEIQHGGILAQMTEMNKTVTELRIVQEQSERERQQAKERAELERKAAIERQEQEKKSRRDRIAAAAFGISIAAIPGVKELVDLIAGLFT